MKKHLLLKLVAVVALVAVVVGFAAMARSAGTTAGTTSDPLVTQSYVENTFRESLLGEVRKQLNSTASGDKAAFDSMAAAFSQQLAMSAPQINAESAYVTLNLSKGETLSLAAGQQLLVLSGSGKVSLNMMVDVTAGKSLAAGNALAENHFYNVPADAAITADSALMILVK